MIFTKEIVFPSQGFTDIINITDMVADLIKQSTVTEGLVTLSVPGSTAGITTIEYESGLIKDLKKAFEKLAPEKSSYAHDDAWGDGNGFSHVRAALLGASRSFPVNKGRVLLGTWQQIVLIDFDNRPRERRIAVQVMGE